MMKDNENVTIIIATHNNSTTIKRAIESVVGGIRPANNVIVGDNNSTDGTYDILCDMVGAESFMIKDQTEWPPEFDGQIDGTPVKIFRKRLNTTGNMLNTAMQMKWQGVTVFGFMDPTSWYAPNKISQTIRVFKSNKHIACVVSDFDNHHPDGRVERIFRCSFDMQQFLVHFPYDRNFLIRPQVFHKLKSGFHEQMPVREDYDLLLRVSEIGLIYHIPEPLHHNTISKIDEAMKQSIAQCEKGAKQMTAQRRGQPSV